MAPSLPSLIALQIDSSSDAKYLGCSTDGNLQGGLEYSFPVLDPTAKFAVEPAKTGGGLVHIRNCKNNKYWVRSSPNEPWIIAAATKPEEDLSAWNCTLFKPEFPSYGHDYKYPIVKFKHCQKEQLLYLAYNSSRKFCLCLQNSSVAVGPAISRMVDYESLVILPKRVAFQGDNERYLQAHTVDDIPYLEFGSYDLGSKWVGEEVYPTDDGLYRFKNMHYGKFWRRSPNWIWADSTDTSSDNLDTLFEAVMVDGKSNVIALRNMGNKHFCKRLTTEGKESCLNAGISNITSEARLTVVEPVLTRSIKGVIYHLDDQKISGQTPLVVATESATNPLDTTSRITIQFTHTKTSTRTWSNSISVKVGIKATLSAQIPFFVEGKTELSAEVANQYQWGESKTETNTTTATFAMDVPPRSIVVVNMVATKATCTIPFSYTQIDQLTNGERIAVTLEDGVYTGVDAIRIDFVPTTVEPLPRDQWK